MKFCKDCKHLAAPVGDALPECEHPSNITADFVTGKKKYINPTALYCRTNPLPLSCGMNALWFEPKETPATDSKS